jgi:hypothetical protein
VTVALAITRAVWFDLFSADPPMIENYAKHVYFCDLHVRLLRESGAFWGYDPTFAAGYLASSGFGVSFLFPAIVSWLTGLSGAVVLKLMLIGYFLISPFCLYAAARLFGLDVRTASIAGLLGVALDHLSVRSAMLMGFVVGFMLAVQLSVLLGAGLYRLNRRRPRPVWSAAITGAAGVLMGSLNLLGLVPLAVVAAGIWWLHRGRFLRPVGLLATALAATAAVAILWPYLGPGLQFTSQWAKPVAQLVFRFFPIDGHFFLSWVALVVVLQPLTLFLAFAGGFTLWRWRREPDARGRYLAFAASAGLLLVVAATAAQLGPYIFPIRFVELTNSVLALPAAATLASVVASPAKTRRAKAGLYGLLALVLAAHLVTVAPTQRAKTRRVDFQQLVKWLGANAPTDSRILIETSHNPSKQILGFDFAALLPYYLPRHEFLAVPSADGPGLIYATYLMPGALSLLPFDAYADTDLADYLRVYNVGTVVAYDPPSVQWLEREPSVEKAGRVGPFHIYRVRHAASFMLAGRGRVRATADGLHLTELTPDPDGKVVLSYHYFRSLRTREGVPLGETRRPNDPFGFITLRNPPPEVTIVNDPDTGFPANRDDVMPFVRYLEDRYHRLNLDFEVPPGTGFVRRRPAPAKPQ